jgi:hypothetical protein
MISKSKTRVLVSLKKDKLKRFREMADKEDLTLSQLISRKLSETDK